MKNIVLSSVAVIALSSFVVAGGDIAPVPVVIDPVAGNFYLGAGYSCLDVRKTNKMNKNVDALMLQAGYKINEYVAVEGRYWYGFDQTVIPYSFALDRFYLGSLGDSVNVNSWGIYAKPMYPLEVFNEVLDIYGLLGYASTDYDLRGVDNDNGFSWGFGAAYSFTENISIFADYVNVYNDDSNEYLFIDSTDNVDTYNFGVSYTF